MVKLSTKLLRKHSVYLDMVFHQKPRLHKNSDYN